MRLSFTPTGVYMPLPESDLNVQQMFKECHVLRSIAFRGTHARSRIADAPSPLPSPGRGSRIIPTLAYHHPTGARFLAINGELLRATRWEVSG